MSSVMQPDDPGAEQPFISHLVELRDRLIRMLIAVGVVVLVLFPFANDIYSYVAAPLIAQLPSGSTMIATQVASPFLTPFKLALVAAIFFAMPYVLYQFWAFVAPGLYQHEKRLAVPLLISSIALFYLGMTFAYFVVFPLIFSFMAGTTPEGVAMMTDITAYLDFVLTLFFAFGIAFQIPIATILLIAIGVVTPEELTSKRPYVIVGAFVIGMFLTPPDVFSQTLLALPMWLLFELGILFSRVLLRGRSSENSAADPPTTPAVSSPGLGGGSGVYGYGGGDPSQARAGSASSAQVVVRESGEAVRPPFLVDEDAETELDLADAEEAHARRSETVSPPTDPSGINSVEERLRRANRLRDLNNVTAARQVLYEVLEEGDVDQRRVARNILQQLDEN
jgi:sec-independent protein translocase protein TatC